MIPKRIADAVKIKEGQRVRIEVVDDKIIIEPIRDAIWLAIHGRKIGKILPKEIEEESLHEQEKLSE